MVDEKDWLLSHIGNVEGSMVAMFGVAISMLVFPLAIYTPDSPHLILFAVLGYACSWGFLLATITGICLRIKAFGVTFSKSYKESMTDLTGSKILTSLTTVIAILSTFGLMAVPWLYMYYLPDPLQQIPVLGDLMYTFWVMLGIWSIGVISTLIIAAVSFWKRK